MIKLLDKEKNYVIVKMDIITYNKLNLFWKEKNKKWYFDDLIQEAKNSKAYSTHEELMKELMS